MRLPPTGVIGLHKSCIDGTIDNPPRSLNMTLTAGKTVTISVTKLPAEAKHRKTIERLMRLQPSIQRTLTRVARERGRTNPENQRGGRMWISRIPATRCVRAEVGAKFTLRVTPKIIPDVMAVQRFIAVA